MKINYRKVVILFFAAWLLLFCSECSCLHDKLVVWSVVHKLNKIKKIDLEKIEDKRQFVASDSVDFNEWALQEQREGRVILNSTDEKTGESILYVITARYNTGNNH